MPLYTTDALILRTYKLGESDRIVVFLTRDRGKKRGVAKNARQSRRRFGGALEPMTYGRVGYVGAIAVIRHRRRGARLRRVLRRAD
jgi:DNA repair protein RecO (recombination protein O)